MTTGGVVQSVSFHTLTGKITFSTQSGFNSVLHRNNVVKKNAAEKAQNSPEMSSNQDDFAPKPKWFLFMTITRLINSFSDLKPCKIIHLFTYLCIKRKELF